MPSADKLRAMDTRPRDRMKDQHDVGGHPRRPLDGRITQFFASDALPNMMRAGRRKADIIAATIPKSKGYCYYDAGNHRRYFRSHAHIIMGRHCLIVAP